MQNFVNQKRAEPSMPASLRGSFPGMVIEKMDSTLV
jgi:hypothetical protein